MPAPVLRASRAVVIGAHGALVAAERDDHHDAIFPHDHDFLEISLVTAGHAVHVSRDGEHALQSGAFVMVLPNEWHAFLDCADLKLFNCFVAPELLDGPLAHFQEDLVLSRALRAGPQVGSLAPVRLSRRGLLSAVSQLEAIGGRHSERASPVAAVGHLLIYLDILNGAWTARGTRNAPAGRPHPAADKAVEIMEGDLAHRWSLAELAAAVAVDPTHLVRAFRRSVGVPPITYLNRRRAQAASALLVQTDLPLARVGRSVGWEDPAYFSRRFRAEAGLSPSAYRRRLLSGKGQAHMG